MSLTTGNTLQSEGRAIPHRCPICAKTPADYTGKLVFPGEEAPMCENHKRALKEGRLTPAQVTMVPVAPPPLHDPVREACRLAGGNMAVKEGWCPGHPAA